jgi:predicted RNA-binding Zn ribbon-like protein
MDELSTRFVADCSGLDFINSGDPSKPGETDWIDSGEKFLTWLEHAQLVPSDVLQRMRSQCGLSTVDEVAMKARAMREWLRDLLQQHRPPASSSVDLSELRRLNEILCGDEVYYCIVAPKEEEGSYSLQPVRRWLTPQTLLYPIGEAIAKLICEVEFSKIRTCEGCDQVFVDRTRRQARRWCRMSTCGNRAKQAAHRNRRRPPVSKR